SRRYAVLFPVSAATGPAGSGGSNWLYSHRNAAQSSTVSVAAFSTAPPTASAPLASAASIAADHPGGTSTWSSITATAGAEAARNASARSSGIVVSGAAG